MDIGKMMKKAGEMQAKMAELQEQIAAMEVTGEAGAGMVKVTLNGKGYVSAVAIDPELFNGDDREVVEDLIAAAVNDARAKVDVQSAEQMKSLTEGLPIPPGMKMPF